MPLSILPGRTNTGVGLNSRKALGLAANYVCVTRLLKEGAHICGVIAQNQESDREFEITARVAINATGVFTDAVRQLDDLASHAMVSASQGAHIVVDRRFLPGESALMVPKTKDGRVLFAIPWHGRVVIGTTDTPVHETPLEPRPMAREIEFLLEHAKLYLATAPGERDILSTFAGLRPLVKAGAGAGIKKLSRTIPSPFQTPASSRSPAASGRRIARWARTW